MLIDEIIDYMENEEKRLKGVGWKDPSGFSRAFLYKVRLLIKSNNLNTILFFLDYKITNLILIVKRLRKELDLPLFEKSLQTKNLRYIEIDVESFFHFSYSLLNIVARLTPLFYKHQTKKLPTKSFNAQRKWYIEHTDLDPEYSEYLKNETRWFEDFLEHRKQLTHYHPLVIFLASDGSVFFGTHRNDRGLIPNVNVAEFINSTANSILEFLVVYDNHFGKKGDSMV